MPMQFHQNGKLRCNTFPSGKYSVKYFKQLIDVFHSALQRKQ